MKYDQRYPNSVDDIADDAGFIDVSNFGRKLGFAIGIGISSKCWAKNILIPEGFAGCESEQNRVWDILYRLGTAIRSQHFDQTDESSLIESVIRFEACLGTARNGSDKWIPLAAFNRTGDDGELMLAIVESAERIPNGTNKNIE